MLSRQRLWRERGWSAEDTRITQYTCQEDHSVHVSRGSLNKRVPCHTGSHPTLEVSEVLQSWAGVGDLAGLLASPVTDPEVTPELTVEVEEFWWTSANKYYIYQEDLYCRYRCIDSMLLQATIVRHYFVKTRTSVASFSPPDLSIIF